MSPARKHSNESHRNAEDNQQLDASEANVDIGGNEEDTLCGFGGWKPAWMQRFATPQFFVLNFSIVAVLQGALFTYLVSIVSTLEKRYAYDSTVTGFILISDNISEMIIAPVIGYIGSKYNRSKLIAFGEVIVALSCLVAASPYFIYGPGLHLLSKQINLVSNQTRFDLCLAKDEMACPLEQESSWAKYFTLPVMILWMFNFLNGVGFTAFYTIGLPYVDDNVKKKNSAIYLSTLSTIRLLVNPGITNKDPRWVGAWWLGFLIIGLLTFLFTLPMFCYPKTLRKSKQSKPNAKPLEITKGDDGVFKALYRLATNGVLVCHSISGILRVVGYLGYYINKPKYMELQYRQSASSASFFTGATSVVGMAIGTLGGGYIIQYFRPKAQTLAIFITSIEVMGVVNLFIASMLKCPDPIFSGLEAILQPKAPGLATCSAGCQCSTRVYQPTCSADGMTNYFSPCYAGCSRYESMANSSKLSFHNCSCIDTVQSPGGWSAESGLCGSNCNMFIWFVVLHAMANMVGSLVRTGDVLLMLRCVEPRDKNFSLGVTGFFFALFAFIPYPIVFGAIIDSTCLIWEKTCGKTGNCWLYDIDKLRIYMHYGSMAFIGAGLLFEIGTIAYASRVKNLYDDNEDDDQASGRPIENIEMIDARLRADSRRSSIRTN